MIIAGEKWACEACVRGHRVSNCQHSDRPLQHINKKGRPVSQCQHCRTLRKSRSAHVRCDCSSSSSSSSSEKLHTKEASTVAGVTQGSCSCSFGGRCTCATKKETLDPVPESDSDGPPIVEKRRARTHTKSPENNLTIFTNGFHKPAHKYNNTAQKYGSPYPAPRSLSLRGPSPSSLVPHSENYSGYLEASSNPIMKETLAVANPTEPNLQASSCTLSDLSPASSEVYFGAQLPMVDLFTPGEISWTQTLDSLSSAPDTDNPLYSAGVNSASIDWSQYEGLDFNNEDFTEGLFSQPSSFTGFDFVSLDLLWGVDTYTGHIPSNLGQAWLKPQKLLFIKT